MSLMEKELSQEQVEPRFNSNKELEDNVVSLLSPDQLAIAEVYEAFLTRTSSGTIKEYSSRVKEFFDILVSLEIIKRPLKLITHAEIKEIKNMHVKKYVEVLRAKGNSDNTIEAKLYTVTSFYNELLKNDLVVNPKIFKVTLNVKEKHHESLSFNELNDLYEFALNEEKELGLEKYLYFKTLFTTGNRKTATDNMLWSNITRRTDARTGKSVWVTMVVDKGDKEVEKPIPDEFYEELQQLNKGEEEVFANISTKTIERALERFSKKLGRKITIHSLKATGVTLGYQLTKDLELCRQYASHEDISTTQIYLREEQSYTNQLSYNLSRKLDETKLLNMSHEELLAFIMNDGNKDIKTSILLRLV